MKITHRLNLLAAAFVGSLAFITSSAAQDTTKPKHARKVYDMANQMN